MERWQEDLVILGQLGRPNGARIVSYDQLNQEMGLYRVEGSSAMKKSKDYFIQRMKEAGLKVNVDRVGNIYGRREGKSGQKVVMTGSHLDTVQNGGMFDGAYGVVGALEAVRRMNDQGFVNTRPIEVIVFMGEEGSAFKEACLGSDVLTGKVTLADALQAKTDQGKTLEEILAESGYAHDFWQPLSEVEYFIELHIEQGPVLWHERLPLGIVESIAGLTYLTIHIEGEENHAGATPMHLRRDPLVAAADLTLFVHRYVHEMIQTRRSKTVATVDTLKVHPGAPSIIPGWVDLAIDIRDSSKENIDHLAEKIMTFARNLEESHNVKVTIEVATEHLPCPLDSDVINVIDTAVQEVGIVPGRMYSGAIHDASSIAHKVKTGMIFVPSKGGISHSPLEWTEWADMEIGIRALTNTLKVLSGN
jgi:hydantoinase/carbamoylase family amidase